MWKSNFKAPRASTRCYAATASHWLGFHTDHHYAAALSDLRNLRAAARPGHHVLLVDDPDHDEVGRAWRAALAEGTVEHFGDVYEDAHGASVYGARAAMVYGAYV